MNTMKSLAILLTSVSVAAATTPSYTPFQFIQVPTNGIVTTTNNYKAVAGGGTNLLCVGDSSVVSLANFSSVSATNGAYLTNGTAWAKSTITNGPNLTTVAYGTNSRAYVASGTANDTFQFNGTGWSTPTQVLGGNNVSAQGVAYNGAAGNFLLVAGFFQAGAAAETNWSAANDLNWNQSVNTVNAAVTESFRGICAAKGNNYAVCGINGDVRIGVPATTNTLTSWNLIQNRIFDFQQPNLNAIASDRNNTLVTAGAGGRVLVSTDYGTTWTTNMPYGTGSTVNFYAVTYTGAADNHFLVAGDNGQVLMASNNIASETWTWTTNWNAGNTLRGATYIDNGIFQGLLWTVGDAGTVVVGGKAPLAPNVNSGSISNCTSMTNCALNGLFGGCSNGTFSAFVSYDIYHPAGCLTIDWLDTNNPAITPTNWQTAATFTPSEVNAGVYTIFVRVRDLRTGLTSTNVPLTLRLNARPFAPMVQFGAYGTTNWTNVVTVQYQTNLMLVADVSASTNLIATNLPAASFPGVRVAVDWYVADVSQSEFGGSLGELATGAVTNWNGTAGWSAGNYLLIASNTPVFHPTNRLSGTYIYYARARVINPNYADCVCQSTNLTQVKLTIIPPAPVNPMGWTNILTAPNQTNAYVSVTVLTNADNPPANFIVDWFLDQATTIPLLNGSETSVGPQFSYVPTNRMSGTYTNWARTRALVTMPTGEVLVSTNLTPVVFQLIPPAPFNPVGWTNVLTAPNQTNAPVSVTVLTNLDNPPANFTVDWFLDQAATIPLLNGSETSVGPQFSYVPTNRVSGTYTNWARTRALVTMPTGEVLVSTNLTPVVFQLIPPAPFNPVGWTNVLTAPNQTNAPVSVTVMTNLDNPPANFTVDWFLDQAATIPLLNGSETSVGPQFSYVPTNRVSGTYTNWARTRALVTMPTGEVLVSTNLTPVVFWLIPPAPVNPVGWTNILTAPNQTNAYVSVTVLTNLDNPPANFTVDWFLDQAATIPLLNGSETSVGPQFSYVPTNRVSGTYTNWARTRALVTMPTGEVLVSTNLTPVVFRLIPPIPTPGLGTGATNDNCALDGMFGGCSNPTLWATVLTNLDNPAGTLTANWYDHNGNLVTNSSLSYTPTDSQPGTYWYWVEAMDTNTTLVSSNRLLLTFVVLPRPAAPLAMTAVVTNVVTTLYQTNTTLAVTIDPVTLGAIQAASPGAVVVADWYTADVSGYEFGDPASVNALAIGATANWDGPMGWGVNSNLLVATNTLVFYPTNRVSGTYIYYVRTRVINPGFGGCICQSTNLTPIMLTILPAAPVNPVGWTNILTAPTQINAAVSVTVLTNFDNPPANFLVKWFADPAATIALLNGSETSVGPQFTYVPTNRVCGTYTNWAQTWALVTMPTGETLMSTNLTPVVFQLIPPVPIPGPGTGATNSNCAYDGMFGGCLNPTLSVTVLTNSDNPGGALTANWYNQYGIQVTNSSLSYTPTDSQPGTYWYWVEAMDTNTLLVSSNRLLLTFVVLPRPAAPPAVAASVTNVVTALFQTNATLAVTIDSVTLGNVQSASPGAVVVADWYTADVSSNEVADLGSINLLAIGAVTNWDGPMGWGVNSNLLVATNTLVFYPTNRVSGTYTYYVRTRVINPGFGGCICQSTNLTPIMLTIIPAAPVNPAGWTNILTAPNQTNASVSVTVLTNFDNPAANFAVEWFADPAATISLSNGTETISGPQFSYVPTNRVSGTYTNWALTLATVTMPTGETLVSTNLTPVVFQLIPPEPGFGTNTSAINYGCTLAGNQTMWVTVLTNVDNPAGTLSANWYDQNGNPLTNSSLTYMPTNTAAGTYVYQVEATNNFLVSSNRLILTYVLENCTLPPAAVDGSGNINFSWYGQLVLQGTTNLAPANWIDLLVPGSVTTNTFTVPATNGVYFFRLYPE